MEEEKEGRLEDQDTKVRKDLRNWGIGLIVIGVVSLIFSNFLNPTWGGLIIATGVLFILIRKPGLYIIGAVLLILAGLYNILIGSLGGWSIFGLFQIGLGISEGIKFIGFTKQSNKEGQRRRWLIPTLGLIPLILVYLTLILPVIPLPNVQTSPEQKTIPSSFITYTDKANHFSISYPSDWTPQSSSLLPSIQEGYQYILLAGPFDLDPNANIVVGQIESLIVNYNLIVSMETDTIKTEGLSLKSKERTIIDGRPSTIFISQDPLTSTYFIQGIFIINRTEWCITCMASSDEYYRYKDDLESIVRSFRSNG
jgi:hypothetical protein